MESLNYRVLFHVVCDEQPALHLVAVCNYDLFITEQRVSSLHRQLTNDINMTGERFNQSIVIRGEPATLNVDLFYAPMDPSEMVTPPDPSLGPAGRIPKSTNTCINFSMRDVHDVLYPLTKPVG